MAQKINNGGEYNGEHIHNYRHRAKDGENKVSVLRQISGGYLTHQRHRKGGHHRIRYRQCIEGAKSVFQNVNLFFEFRVHLANVE